ncbi:hypothetical protein Plhal304r1_c009g0036401 [Plasmopara halstedii]
MPDLDGELSRQLTSQQSIQIGLRPLTTIEILPLIAIPDDIADDRSTQQLTSGIEMQPSRRRNDNNFS